MDGRPEVRSPAHVSCKSASSACDSLPLARVVIVGGVVSGGDVSEGVVGGGAIVGEEGAGAGGEGTTGEEDCKVEGWVPVS